MKKHLLNALLLLILFSSSCLAQGLSLDGLVALKNAKTTNDISKELKAKGYTYYLSALDDDYGKYDQWYYSDHGKIAFENSTCQINFYYKGSHITRIFYATENGGFDAIKSTILMKKLTVLKEDKNRGLCCYDLPPLVVITNEAHAPAYFVDIQEK